MRKNQKNVLIGVLSLCVCMAAGIMMSTDVKAEEFADRPYIGVDEEGNVFEVEPEIGVVEENEGDISTFSRSNEMVVNFNTKNWQTVTNYVEVGTGDAGYTNGSYGADGAYLGEEGGKVKFMLSGVVGLVNKSDVQIIKKSAAKSLSYYTVRNGQLMHYITYNMNQSNNYPAIMKQGKAPSYLAEGAKYYSYDGHYFYGENQYGVMLGDYSQGNRNNSVNPSTPYYNYYQFLPMRSVSAYSTDEMSAMINGTLDTNGYSNSKMRDLGTSFVNNQNTYGVNALIAASHGALESAWGTSTYAMARNNLFGINAVDSNPDDAFSFPSADACVKTYTETYMSKQYINPLDWKYWGGFWGNKASGANVKYASDPYGGEKIANIAWNLDARGGNRDQYKYTIAIKDPIATQHNTVLVRSESNANSTVMYKSGTQSNTAFLLMEANPQNGFYKVQTDGVLHGDRSGVNSNSGTYDFSKMYGYIDAGSVTVVNTGGDVATGVDGFTDVNNADWYYDSVKFVYERGIMTGLNSFTVGPSGELSRAQFATILYRLAGSPAASYQNIFPDVTDGNFYTAPVMWAYQNGVISGYENGYFGTADKINREQLATMMYRYAKLCNLDISQTANINSFPDASIVSEYAREAMRWAVGSGMIQGDQGNLNPHGDANRAQAATIITRYIQSYGL